MKYKFLLTGKNNATLDDFFNQLNKDYNLLTTSYRFEDMENHLSFFEPDLMFFCLGGENQDELKRINELKRKLKTMSLRIVIIGEAAEVAYFQEETNNLANLVLTRPITISNVKDCANELLEELEAEREEIARNTEEAKRAAARQAEIDRRKHILVVDDEPFMLKLLQEQLSPYYDVATAVSGKIALKFLEKKATDLVLLDYEMPVENGPAVLEKIRENPETADLPVIFITGVSDKEKIRHVLSLKPQGYILKPVENKKLLNTVESYFAGVLENMFG